MNKIDNDKTPNENNENLCKPVHIKYETKPGETLYKVARQTNATIEALVKLNDLEMLSLLQGQLLLIPVVTSSATRLHEYLTQPADTIKSIAEKFSVTAEQIIYFNTIDRLILQQGMVVFIPRQIQHKVTEMDTIESILETYNLTERELIELNPEWVGVGTFINVISK